MKTPEEILRVCLGSVRYDLSGSDNNSQVKLAMKEYAKQWVDRVIIDMYETHVIGTVDVYFKQIDAQ